VIKNELWCWSGNERGTAKLYLLELDRTVILSNVLLTCGGYIDGLL